MRPASIVWFERLFLLSLAIALVSSVMQYDALIARVESDPAFVRVGFGVGVVVAVMVMSLLIPLLLWYLIARRASNAAKWILVALTAIGLLFLDIDFARLADPGTLLTVAVTILQLGAIAMLFRADARAWLSGGEDHGATP